MYRVFLCIVLLTCAATQTSSQNIATEFCLFGGTCQTPTPGGTCATRCLCVQGYFGDRCENVYTRFNGRMVYSIGNTTRVEQINIIQLQTLMRTAIGTSFRNTEFGEPIIGDKEAAVDFYFDIERPSDWENHEDAQELHQNLLTSLSSPLSIQRVLGTNVDISISSFNLDIDECFSNWTNCPSQSSCVNQDPGFICQCNSGFSGADCSPITCLLSDAPAAPSLATRVFANENGTEIPNPDPVLPFDTSITYSCPDRYVLVDDNDNILGLQSISCDNDGWGAFESSSCTMDLGFRIAVGMAITSSLIIIIVVGALATNYCLAAEKKAKARRQEVENFSFDGV